MRLFLMFLILFGFYNGAYGRVYLDIDMKLKTLNKPALKTIKSEDGDIIDCVDIYKQHAFDHPALKDHKIQMKPSVEFDVKKTIIPNNSSSKPIVSQTWTKSGECPDGTIPVRRVSREDISRASSPSQFGRKTPHRYRFQDKANKLKANSTPPAYTIKNRSEALIVALAFQFNGVQSDINVWNPPNVQSTDYTTGQIWMLANTIEDQFESVEAGWMVNPSVFGDYRTRLFAYWTKDAYISTGCINLLCAGFVQTTKRYALGAVIEPISTKGGAQYHISASMFLDPNTKNWWLTFGDNVMGYWPGTLFGVLSHSATAVQWGGEVYSPNVFKKPHTRTTMGSGQWPSYYFGSAAFHTNLRIRDNSMQIKYPQYLNEYADEYDCYSTQLHRDSYKGEPYLFFGGPGQNRLCP